MEALKLHINDEPIFEIQTFKRKFKVGVIIWRWNDPKLGTAKLWLFLEWVNQCWRWIKSIGFRKRFILQTTLRYRWPGRVVGDTKIVILPANSLNCHRVLFYHIIWLKPWLLNTSKSCFGYINSLMTWLACFYLIK